MSTAPTTPAATTGPEARERSGHDDGGTGARRRQRSRVLDRPGARAVVGLAVPAALVVLWWAVTAAGGTHVCLRRVDPALIFPAIARHRVTHMCGAPIVMTTLIHAPDAVKVRFDHTVEIATGGAAPPSAVIEAMEAMGEQASSHL